MNSIKKQAGATLLEGLIAIVIFSIGLLGLVSFQLVSMQQSQQARYRAMASFYAEQLLGNMQADSTNLTLYTGTTCPASGSPTGGTAFVTWCNAMKSNTDAKQTLPITDAIVNNNAGVVTVTIKWKSVKDTDASQYILTTNLSFMQAVPT